MAGFSASTYGALVGLIKETLAGAGAIQGIPGKTPELQATSTHIQWRYIGDTTWMNLVALSVLEGTDGADESPSAIKDSVTGTGTTWSSSKIVSEIGIANTMLQARLNGG